MDIDGNWFGVGRGRMFWGEIMDNLGRGMWLGELVVIAVEVERREGGEFLVLGGGREGL